MKETQPAYSHSIHDAVDIIQGFIPPDILPHSSLFPYSSIFETLQETARLAPSLEGLIAAVVKTEILDEQSKRLPAAERTRISSLLKQLPDLDHENIEETPLDHHELFLLHHDMNLVILRDRVHLADIQAPKLDQLMEKIRLHGILSYNWERAEKTSNSRLTLVYAALVRLFAAEAILPAIQEAIQEKIPIGKFELYEARSCYRELAQLPSTTFAQAFRLKSAIEEFVRMRQFHDKNSHLPVEVEFDPRSTDPLVYMDIGDIYRMVRNLLRDAVTHGQAAIIRPVILIEEKPDHVCLSILSQGTLDEQTLQYIGRVPYTTQDRGEKPHGYGKVSARRLITQLWADLGLSIGEIESLMKDHWSNVFYHQAPHVRWTAPLPAGR